MKERLFIMIWCLLTSSYSYCQSPISKFEIIMINDSIFQFKDKSEGAVESLLWEFYDGNHKIETTEQNPTVKFSLSDKVISKLIVANSYGKTASKRIIYMVKGDSIDLNTGTRQDGTLLNEIEDIDKDWEYISPNGERKYPYTRQALNGWSSPSTGDKFNISRWITGGNITKGYHYYNSKIFSIPMGVEGFLNLRSLSFVRNWTYLVKINDDNSESEVEVTKTSWQRDGAKGWLNSRNPEVINYKISPGKYYIKVKSYTNNSSQRQAINVNGNVKYGKHIKISELEVESVINKDYRLAPNSYVFDIDSDSDGLYIPVKKAYDMWASTAGPTSINQPISDFTKKLTAFVFWEDVSGLIKSTENYRLNIIGESQLAKIEVPINKTVGKGNAVVSFHVGDQGDSTDPIYWSWHIWVTDNPYNGSKYRQGFETRQLENGIIEIIPDQDWGWMDRNLGAISNIFNGALKRKSGGLLYQWGRKDPIPSLVANMDDFYEVEGVIGKVRHKNAKYKNGSRSINDLVINESSSQIFRNQLIKSIRNPLSLLYINLNYNNNSNLPYNWFGDTDDANYPSYRLARLNLWSDNSKGISNELDPNSEISRKPYQTKSYFDPCPNGWRVPSVLVSHTMSDGWGIKDLGIRLDYSPFGLKRNITNKEFERLNNHIIRPNDDDVPTYMKGVRIYNKIGFDLSNVNGENMGLFPGTGFIAKNKSYTDSHETYLWTATMMSWFYKNKTPHVEARSLRLVPDGDQKHIVDTKFPLIHGSFLYYPLSRNSTSDALACRCIKDPLYIVNNYDFQTEFFKNNDKIIYKEGLNEPNTYNLYKKNIKQIIEIPISKAFSVYNQILSDNEMLELGNLKSNIVWTTNKKLIENVNVNNPNASLENLKDTKILVTISPNQSGNALVSLHNGDIKNPIYWSWHIWISDTEVKAMSSYTTEKTDPNITNYIGYAQNNLSLTSQFMDRNLGALNSFSVQDKVISEQDRKRISTSGGFLYQYGRKDPIPSFESPDKNTYVLYKGMQNIDGSIVYTELDRDTYKSRYFVEYKTYSKQIIFTDKKYQKVRKNIIYSIRNPLLYMLPSAYNNVSSIGTDWVLDEPNEASNRWGYIDDDKSVFDPCPYGWKVPNILSGSSDFLFQKGTTPWYKKEINEVAFDTSINDYLGEIVKLNNKIVGYTFPLDYNIGNYPFMGIIGFRANTVPFSKDAHNNYSGVWSAGFSSHYKGFANGILFDNTLNSLQVKRNYDPYMAMSVRCVKYDKESLQIQNKDFLDKDFVEVNEREGRIIKDFGDISVYPNPTDDIIFLSVHDFEYKIMDIYGKVVKKGYTNLSTIDLSELSSGIYILNIKKNVEKSFKIIKK